MRGIFNFKASSPLFVFQPLDDMPQVIDEVGGLATDGDMGGLESVLHFVRGYKASRSVSASLNASAADSPADRAAAP